MKEKYNIRAKEFYSIIFFKGNGDIKIHPADGNIMLGNSATPMNNHLDVIDIVSKYKLEFQKAFIPLSYGDQSYKNLLIENLNSQNKYKGLELMTDFMPKEKYWNHYNSCSYACYGVLRQQAGANIRYALSHGIKVFLFRDSIAYKHYKEAGFEVFSLEDADERSFCEPLTEEQNKTNLEAIKKDYMRRQIIYEECIKEIENKMLNK